MSNYYVRLVAIVGLLAGLGLVGAVVTWTVLVEYIARHVGH